MFCKASVLKCPGLKKKGSLHCFACRVISFRIMEILKSFVPPVPPKKDNVACWLKLEQSALKH